MPTQNTMSWVNYAQNYQEKGESIVQKIIWCIGNVKTHVDSALQSPAKNDSMETNSSKLLQLKSILGGISKLDRNFSNDINPYLRCSSVDELIESYESIKRSNYNSTRVKHLALLKFACKQFSQR